MNEPIVYVIKRNHDKSFYSSSQWVTNIQDALYFQNIGEASMQATLIKGINNQLRLEIWQCCTVANFQLTFCHNV